MVHGCRQLVSWDVGLSPATSATLIASYQHVMVGTLAILPVTNRRKVGMTSNHHAPYDQGDTRTTMPSTASCNTAKWSQSLKTGPSSDRRLQFVSVKLESLVNAYQHDALNTFSGLVHTARHTMEVSNTRSRWANARGSCRRWDWWLGWSRNKVTVGEPAVGSPPFYGEHGFGVRRRAKPKAKSYVHCKTGFFVELGRIP